jgi:HK97 family phage portal protein
MPDLANKATLASRVKSWLGLPTGEGSWRGPLAGIGDLGRQVMLGALDDGWQTNVRVSEQAMRHVPAIASARHLYASAFAQLQPRHNRFALDGSGGVEEVLNSQAVRVLTRPNAYETGADFLYRFVQEWLSGEVLVIVGRNNRTEVDNMHIVPRGLWQPYVSPEDKSIFYGVSNSSELLTPQDLSMMIPARDVLHLRWSTPRHPLMGEGPLAAAALAAGVNIALSQSSATFFQNMRRASGALSTEMELTKDQMKRLREAFDEQAALMAKGGVPILASGLKFTQMSMTSQDAQVVETMRMTTEDIARAYSVPPPLLGDLSNATLANVEQLVSHWLSISLGACIERAERAFDRLFQLDSRADRLELDTSNLLRADMLARMEAYAKGTQAGILTSNDARRRERLPPKPGGDQLLVQRQNIPIALATQLAEAELTRGEPATPRAPDQRINTPEPVEEEPTDA